MDKNSDVTVNTSKGPSNKWLRSFLKRHPEISIRTPDSIDRGRYGMANTTVMNDHFQLLEKCLQNLGKTIVFICNINYKESKVIKNTAFLNQSTIWNRMRITLTNLQVTCL